MQPIADWVRDATVNDFEAMLAQRAEVSEGAREQQVEQLPDAKLENYNKAVARILIQFAEAVARATTDTSLPDTFVDTFDLRYISRDHDWRAVFSALRDQGAGHRRHKLVAMEKYLQYLATRRELIEKILADRERLQDTGGHDDPTVPEARDATLLDPLADGEPVELKRLPNGESVEIELPADGSVRMQLGRHPFSLVGGTPQLIDENQHSYPLRRGRQSVGRHAECHVRVNANFSKVSRIHMLVEWRGENVLSITDVSSLGTFVDPHAILEN
jgi:hypothetical protein